MWGLQGEQCSRHRCQEGKGGNKPKPQDQEGTILIPSLLLLNWKLGSLLYINIALHPFSILWKKIHCNILSDPFYDRVITVKTEAWILFLHSSWGKKMESTYCLFGCGWRQIQRLCNNLFQETVRCSKALCGHFNMVIQELTAVEHLSRVTASKSSLIITDHLENNWAVHCPLDWGRQKRERGRRKKDRGHRFGMLNHFKSLRDTHHLDHRTDITEPVKGFHQLIQFASHYHMQAKALVLFLHHITMRTVMVACLSFQAILSS